MITEPLRFLISNHEGHFSLHKEKQGILILLRELRVLRGWNKINILQEKCKTTVTTFNAQGLPAFHW
jgi:hypothetical protein